ncbi:hypothetical protein ACFRJ8_21385 [Arthrobacter sp. NPDC056886]|uniref:hypothetical protein n=1 Tax=Arthrobacter sp. NPDC056886 TaxID=3345960 RepID=UPI0036730C1F
MDNASEPAFLNPEFPTPEFTARKITGPEIIGPEIAGRETAGPKFTGRAISSRELAGGQHPGPDPSGPCLANTPPRGRSNGEPGAGVLKAMSPGVVDFLFRRLVAGEPAEDVQWGKEGTALAVQPPGAELARRLAETDLDALTPTELFHYVRAAQRLAAWAEALRETAVARYCSAPSAPSGKDEVPRMAE